MTIKKLDELFFKNGYELREVTQKEAYNLELNSQIYIKKNGVAYPARVVKCFENAQKFGVEVIK